MDISLATLTIYSTEGHTHLYPIVYTNS